MTQNRCPTPAWAFSISSIALFMAALDNLVVTTALPGHPARPRRNLAELEWIVNAYTLTFAVLLLTGRRARRPVRAQAPVHHRPGDLHRRLGARRAVAVDRAS